MKIAGVLGKLVGGSAAEIVEKVGGVIDNLTLSKEEKASIQSTIEAEINRHNEAVLTAANDMDKAYLEDTQSARTANASIQESDKASWLAKNVAYLLDITFVVAFFVGLLMIMFRAVPQENKELFYTGFGLLGGYVSTILGFHRGTSAGSKASADTLRHIVKNK